MQTRHTQLRRKRWLVWLLILLFVAPILLARIFYNFFTEPLRQHTVNHGHLIQPVRSLTKLSFTTPQGKIVTQERLTGHWIMLYINPRQCRKTCEDNLYNMRQIHRATGKNQSRVQRVIVTFNTTRSNSHLQYLLNGRYAGTLHWIINRHVFTKFIKDLPSAKTALHTGALYFVDPRGDLFISYPPYTHARNILKDLERLLRLSQIG